MNKHILLVMKWLDNKDSVTQQELIDNRKSAYDTATYVHAVAAVAVAAAADADAAVAADTAVAQKWISKHFEKTKENKQDYIDAIKPIDDKPIYTKAMQEAGELPNVGMECLVKRSHLDDSNLLGCYIIGYSQDKNWLVFEDADDHLLYHNIKNGTFEFKPLLPIDTRTDKQKISEMLWDLISDNINSDSLIEEIRHDILNNKNLKITWSK